MDYGGSSEITFTALCMIINADSLLPLLKKKVRPLHSDASRHLICPDCGIRTKLNVLGDGRRKCTVCGKKFRIHKATTETKLQQCAEILLCFCLDFSARRTSVIAKHRYRLVIDYYEHFRRTIADSSAPTPYTPILSAEPEPTGLVQAKGKCRWCKSPIRLKKEAQALPVFGVQWRAADGTLSINPLKDDQAHSLFPPAGVRAAGPASEGYVGFICCGKFNRFFQEEKTKSEIEEPWKWVNEGMRNHHGIWKRNTGFYLKEMEWKYNHRSLTPETQAGEIIALMPANFLEKWSGQKGT